MQKYNILVIILLNEKKGTIAAVTKCNLTCLGSIANKCALYIGIKMNEKKPSNKFIVTKKPAQKEEKSVNMTLRINKDIQRQYDEWASKTNRSRNELMCRALAYALENLEFIED